MQKSKLQKRFYAKNTACQILLDDKKKFDIIIHGKKPTITVRTRRFYFFYSLFTITLHTPVKCDIIFTSPLNLIDKLIQRL